MWHWENKQFYEQGNEMGVAKAFWIVLPGMEGFGKTTNILYLETMLTFHQNKASQIAKLFLLPFLTHPHKTPGT